MTHSSLFFGFRVPESYQEELLKLPSVEKELFIQSQVSPYLQQIEHEGRLYLGKSLGPSIEMANLDSLHSHIYSLLKKLVPSFPYEQHPLLLLALPT
jgi:hypothetical protein